MKTNHLATAIMVDEMNVIGQLHRIGIKGINPWNAYYEAIQQYFGLEGEKHFYCSNVPEETYPKQFMKRLGFFNALRNLNIDVHEGFVVKDHQGKLVRKAVDVLLGMDITLLAMSGMKDIIICSGDSGLVPAIKRAQSYGTHVHVVVSKKTPAANIVDVADSVVSLEEILQEIPKQMIIRKTKERIHAHV